MYILVKRQRNLAKETLENYQLHREFVNLISREFFISKNTIEKQVAYGESVANKQREIAAIKKDIGVIAVKKREIAHQVNIGARTVEIDKNLNNQNEKELAQ